MKFNERPKVKVTEPIYELYEGEPFYKLLLQLPPALAKLHMEVVEREGKTPDQITEYLQDILSKRKVATTRSVLSDPYIVELCNNPREQIYQYIEHEVINGPDIGSGMTARVKEFRLKVDKVEIPMAVKYLVTPTSKTLTASAEHDMIAEVERIQTIEDLEKENDLKYVKVPHPYFHHKNQRLQCYGMELVDGVNIQELLEDEAHVDVLKQIEASLHNVPQEVIAQEMERFLKKMHVYCLHGDIKPRNIMVNKNGVFYIIDFGQSLLVQDISEDGMEQLENLREAEVQNTKTIIHLLYKKLFA